MVESERGRWKPWKWKIHWQIALAIAAGLLVGVVIGTFDPEARLATESGGRIEVGDDLRIVAVEAEGSDPRSPVVAVGDVIVSTGGRPLSSAAELRSILSGWARDARLSLRVRRAGRELALGAKVEWRAGSTRSRALAPLELLAMLFRRSLQMLVVPLILTSLVSGVASLGDLRALGRMGLKTLGYYVLTSLLAILVGLLLVNLLEPGVGAPLDLAAVDESRFASEEGLGGIFIRMVPENVFSSLSENGRILQVIFFSLLLGAFIARGAESSEPVRLVKRLFAGGFELMMKISELVLLFLPIGVFALIARVVGVSGFAVFRPLLLLMLTVVLALAVHAGLTLPLLLKLLAGIRPLHWARAVFPALITAFSTSSSAITLPETMRSVEERGGVSNRTASFVLPLGATINMDGTALYECVGVIFLAQYYGSAGGYELTWTAQLVVVVTALLASVGAAGIPSAGLVMMTTILAALKLPPDGVILLLAIDRPLDMLRTAVNVWSDTTCSAVVGRSEGEKVPASC